MPDATLDSVFVVLCDWRGRITWGSRITSVNEQDEYVKIGDFAWVNLSDQSKQEAMTVFSRVVTLRETRSVELTNLQGGRIRCWMWPLDSPEVAVCLLGMRIPTAFGRLTKREKQCLEFLASGTETREIAKQLDVSLSTIHTHIKRSREKLGLPNVEALISFAARYCYPSSMPLVGLPQSDVTKS